MQKNKLIIDKLWSINTEYEIHQFIGKYITNIHGLVYLEGLFSSVDQNLAFIPLNQVTCHLSKNGTSHSSLIIFSYRF